MIRPEHGCSRLAASDRALVVGRVWLELQQSVVEGAGDSAQSDNARRTQKRDVAGAFLPAPRTDSDIPCVRSPQIARQTHSGLDFELAGEQVQCRCREEDVETGS